jgi:hypothetical protein
MQEKEGNIEETGSKKNHPEPGILQANAFLQKSFGNPAPILSHAW